MNIINKLSGYKTYITVCLTILVSLIGAIHGGATPLQAGVAALVSLAVAFARAGSKQDAVRSAAIVVSELAPMAGAVLPNGIAKAVGDAAASAAAEIAAPVAASVAAPVAAAIADAAPVAAEIAAPITTMAETITPTTAEMVDAVLSAFVARLGGPTPPAPVV